MNGGWRRFGGRLRGVYTGDGGGLKEFWRVYGRAVECGWRRFEGGLEGGGGGLEGGWGH